MTSKSGEEYSAVFSGESANKSDYEVSNRRSDYGGRSEQVCDSGEESAGVSDNNVNSIEHKRSEINSKGGEDSWSSPIFWPVSKKNGTIAKNKPTCIVPVLPARQRTHPNQQISPNQEHRLNPRAPWQYFHAPLLPP